ncbi:hypothetical protein EV426DRAFT_608607 [Tirmania nivea]|nr:hypothetical protein EV426DRAFT_608607 [Tirmania nivea]
MNYRRTWAFANFSLLAQFSASIITTHIIHCKDTLLNCLTQGRSLCLHYKHGIFVFQFNQVHYNKLLLVSCLAVWRDKFSHPLHVSMTSLLYEILESRTDTRIYEMIDIGYLEIRVCFRGRTFEFLWY